LEEKKRKKEEESMRSERENLIRNARKCLIFLTCHCVGIYLMIEALKKKEKKSL
jgi:hypothetical protein